MTILDSIRKQIKFLKSIYNEKHERFYNPDYSSIIENKIAKLIRTCKRYLESFSAMDAVNKMICRNIALSRVKGIFWYLIGAHNYTMGFMNRYNLDKIWDAENLNLINVPTIYQIN